MLLKIFQV